LLPFLYMTAKKAWILPDCQAWPLCNRTGGRRISREACTVQHALYLTDRKTRILLNCSDAEFLQRDGIAG